MPYCIGDLNRYPILENYPCSRTGSSGERDSDGDYRIPQVFEPRVAPKTESLGFKVYIGVRG